MERDSFSHKIPFKYLPSEILMDILGRLPVRALINLSCVCKSWYSFISHPSFIASYLNRGKGYLLHMPLTLNDQQIYRAICDRTLTEQFNLSFPFDCESFKISVAGSCDGLLCLTDDDSNYFGRIVYLWNPSIRRLKPLPRSPHVTPRFFDTQTSVVLGLGFDHVNGDYKVIRLSYFWDKEGRCFGHIPYEAELYTLGTNSWRKVSSSNVLCRAQKSSMAFLNGSIHWIVQKPKSPDCNLILSFDFSSEMFHEMMVPSSCYTGIVIHSEVLAEFHGSLSLLINGNTTENLGTVHCCYMWVMKEYGVSESWTKHFRFVAKEGIHRLPGLTNGGEIIYQNNKMEYFLCDPVDGQQKNTGLRGFRFHLVGFRESLVLLEHIEFKSIFTA